MNNQATVDQIQYLFTFPFKDADWKRKFLIGFLLYFAGFIIPVIPWIFVSGYIAKIIKMGIEGEYSLPEWEDWGDLLVQGLKLLGVMLIASLPFFILFGCGYISLMTPALLGGFGAEAYGDEFLPALVLMPFATFGGMCLMSLGILFSFLIWILVPPAISHMIAKDQFSAAFRVSEWWGIFKANIGGYLIAYVLMMGTSFLFGFALQLLYLTFILCCLFPFVVSLISMYISVVMGAIFGQAYRVGVENRALVLLPDETLTADNSE